MGRIWGAIFAAGATVRRVGGWGGWKAQRRYITADPEWDALLRRTRASGKALGIAMEADVERLSDEFRQERLQASNHGGAE